MKNMFNHKWDESWLEKRLVWMLPAGPEVGGANDVIVVKEGLKDKDDKALEANTLQAVGERLQKVMMEKTNLNFPTTLALRNLLKAKVDNIAGKDAKVKGMSNYLVDESIKKAVLTGAEINGGMKVQNGALDKWLADNKVTAVEIKAGPEGGVVFYSKDGLVTTPNFLKKEAEEGAKKVDDKRQEPGELEKVFGETVKLADSSTLKDLTAKLETAVGGKIKAGEMMKTLQAYIEAASPEIKDADPVKLSQLQFKAFMAKLAAKGYENVIVVGGKLVFNGKGGRVDNSNPLDLQTNLGGEKFAPKEIFVHEVLEKKAVKEVREKKEAEAKAAKGKGLKTTLLDATEKEVAGLLGEPKLENIDKRYLSALKGILDYKNGEPINISIPENDKPLPDCQFFRNTDGNYVIVWGKAPNQYWEYAPKDRSPNGGLKEAQANFAKVLNNGTFLETLQTNSVKNKAAFEDWGMVVDAGPKDVGNSTFKYEFDWKTGVGGDPDVSIRVQKHGELVVTVDQGDIGEPRPYIFRAGGFQDMMRNLKALQNYAEAPKEEKQKMKGADEERRFFAQGAKVLQAEVVKLGVDVGKILKTNSNGDGTIAEANMSKGYSMEFDWMQKLEPKQKLTIISNGDGGGYGLRLEPSGQILGIVKAPIKDNFGEAMKLVAGQKEVMTLNEGKGNMTKNVQKLLDGFSDVEGPLELAGGVRVVGVSGEIVYLAMPGCDALPFSFGKMPAEGHTKLGTVEAREQGYLLVKPWELVGKELVKLGVEPVKPVAEVNIRRSATEVRGEPEKVVDHDVKQEASDPIFKDLKGPSADEIKKYLVWKLLAFPLTGEKNDRIQQFQGALWKSMAELAEKPETTEHADILKALNAPDFGKKMAEKMKGDLAFFDKVKDKPLTRAFLKGLVDSLKLLSPAEANMKDDSANFDKAKKAYLDGLNKLVEEMVNKKPGLADDDLRKSVLNSLRMPVQFCRDFKDNEDKKVAHDKWEADVKKPAGAGEVKEVKKPEPVSAELSNAAKEVPDLTEKKLAVDDVMVKDCKMANSFNYPNYQSYRKFVLGKMEVESSVKTGDEKKADYKTKVWEKLAELAGAAASNQIAILKALEGSKLSTSCEAKIKALPEGIQKSLAATPSALANVAGLVDSLDSSALNYKDLKIGDSEIPAAKEAYKSALLAVVKKVMDKPRQKGVLDKAYDILIEQALSDIIKTPGQFMKEYGERLGQKKEYDKFNETKAKIEVYEKAQKDPNKQSYEDFKKAPMMSGIGVEAIKYMELTKGIVKTGKLAPGLANVEPNSTASDVLAFNVAGIGPDGGKVPMTLHFYKQGESLMVNAVSGWNNIASFPSESYGQGLSGGDTIKYAVDYALTMAPSNSMHVPEALQSPDKPVAAPEVPKKTEGPKAPEVAPVAAAK